MIYAAYYNLSEIAKSLIAQSADVNIVSNAQKSPLLLAAQRGANEVTAILLENKANTEHVDKEQNNALILASSYDTKLSKCYLNMACKWTKVTFIKIHLCS